MVGGQLGIRRTIWESNGINFIFGLKWFYSDLYSLTAYFCRTLVGELNPKDKQDFICTSFSKSEKYFVLTCLELLQTEKTDLFHQKNKMFYC